MVRKNTACIGTHMVKLNLLSLTWVLTFLIMRSSLSYAQNAPKGAHDLSDCTATAGWSCDPDEYTKTLAIHFYRDGPAGEGGTFLGSTIANQTREEAVGTQCGDDVHHGFTFPTPDFLKDGTPHSIYTYAVNIGAAGSNPLLSGSPREITCAPPLPASPGNLSPNGGVFSSTTTSVTLSWSLVSGATSYAVRANDETDTALRDPRNNCPGNPHYLCLDGGTFTSISLPVRSGHSYSWWVHACNTSGCGLAAGATFQVQGNGAQFVSQRVPSLMAAGFSYKAEITLKNTGSATWSKTSGYKLGSQNPPDNSTWGIGRVNLGDADSIAPGNAKTFSFNVTAPGAAGTYNFQWRMVQELVEWFGELTPNATVQVQVPPSPSNFTKRGWTTISGSAGGVLTKLDAYCPWGDGEAYGGNWTSTCGGMKDGSQWVSVTFLPTNSILPGNQFSVVTATPTALRLGEGWLLDVHAGYTGWVDAIENNKTILGWAYMIQGQLQAPPFSTQGTYVMRFRPAMDDAPWSPTVTLSVGGSVPTIDMTRYWPRTPGSWWEFSGFNASVQNASGGSFLTKFRIGSSTTVCGLPTNPVAILKDAKEAYWYPGGELNLNWFVAPDFEKRNNWPQEYLWVIGDHRFTRDPSQFDSLGSFTEFTRYVSQDEQSYPAYVLFPKQLNIYQGFSGSQKYYITKQNRTDCSWFSPTDPTAGQAAAWNVTYELTTVRTARYSGPAVKVHFVEDFPGSGDWVEDWYFAKDVGLVQVITLSEGTSATEFPRPPIRRILILTNHYLAPTGNPPVVAITTPTAGATLSGLIQITGTVADADGDLASVEVSTNGGNSFAPAVWGVGAGNLLAWAYPSFSASLDTTQVPNGTYTLMARAKDAAGNVGGPVLISVTVQNQTVSGSRTFWMGTTPFTFQPGTFIEARFENPSDKDLLSLHADDFWGVPWDSFLNDTPLPTPWASRWQAVASSATASGKTLYLALSPLSDRKTLTRRVNPDGSTTDNWAPADSEGCYLFSSDPNAANYKAAYIRYVQYLVDLVHPRFLSPALELSLQFAKCPAQKQAFMQWYADVHNALKAANPNLIIFPTFQMEFMYGVVDPAAACSAGTSYADCFRQRLQEALGVPSDRIAFSMYPHLWGNLGPSIADLDPFSTVQSLTSKTIWIGETGWNTVRILSQYAPTCGTDWIPASVANEAKQNEYMSWLLGQAQSRQFEAVVWWLNRDTLDAATAATCPCSGDSATCTFTADFYTLGGNLGELVLRMFGNMALRTYDGSPRPAHATWTSYMNLTFTGDTGGGGDIVVTTSTSVVVGTSGGVLGDLQTHGASVVISEGTLSQSLTISIAPATPDGTQSQAMQSQGFTSASPTVNLYAVGFESGYHFSRNVTVTLRYDPNVVQNTSALTIAWWDTGQGQWQPIAPGNCRVDPGSSTIACTVDHFTTFGVFEVAVPAAASLEFGEVFVYPNPAAHPQQPTLHIEVGTVEEVEIQIYDLAGTAVDRIELRGGPRVGINGKLAYEHVWDTQNVAAGGYAALIRASSGGSSIRRTVKFAVVK